MKHYIIRFARHPLITGSTIIFLGSFTANVLGYAFNLIMGRALLVSDYGIYSTLMSLLGIFSIFQTSFATIFAKFAAVYTAHNETEKINSLLYSGARIVLIFATVIFIFLLMLMFPISSFLHIKDTKLLFFIFLTIFISIISSLLSGVLQGKMRFYLLSFIAVISPFLKIIIGLLLLLLGLKIFGVTIAIFLSTLVPFIFLVFLFSKNIKKPEIETISESIFFKEFKEYSLRFFLASLGITILASADIILVKHFFTPEQSGQYAALSLMGKAIFYLTSPIYFVFFPLIAQKKERKESIYETLFFGLGIITLFSVSLSFVYFLFPNIILRIFFPAKEYSILASYLGPFSLYIIVFSLASLFNNFLLSIGKTGIYKINLLVSVIFILLMFIFHASFYQVIGVLFFVSFVHLLSLLLYYFYSEKEKATSY